MVANKNDIIDENPVTEEEGLKYAQDINAHYITTSSLINTNVFELFSEIGKEIINNRLSNTTPPEIGLGRMIDEKDIDDELLKKIINVKLICSGKTKHISKNSCY